MTKHVPIKATRARVGNDPETRPTGPRGLAFAILSQGLEDAKQGHPDAREWLDGRAFEYWCDQCGMNPGYLRRMMRPFLTAPQPRPRSEKIRRILSLREQGLSYLAIAQIIGNSTEYVYQVVTEMMGKTAAREVRAEKDDLLPV